MVEGRVNSVSTDDIGAKLDEVWDIASTGGGVGERVGVSASGTDNSAVAANILCTACQNEARLVLCSTRRMRTLVCHTPHEELGSICSVEEVLTLIQMLV